MNRRGLIKRVFSFVAILGFGSSLSGCGEDEPNVPAEIPDMTSEGCGGGLAADGVVSYGGGTHDHGEINLTAAQIDAAEPGMYSLLDGGHNHEYMVTAQNFADLQEGTPVTLTEATLHNHSITIACS